MRYKTVLPLAFIAVISAIVMAIVLTGSSGESSEYARYKRYSNELAIDWKISQDTAQSFANSNCDKLAVGQMPAIRFQNTEHVESSAAVIAAYCPDSFENFLAGVITKYPEYKSTALYVNERLEVDSA